VTAIVVPDTAEALAVKLTLAGEFTTVLLDGADREMVGVPCQDALPQQFNTQGVSGADQMRVSPAAGPAHSKPAPTINSA